MTGPRSQTVSERFWAKVEKTDTCWLWTAATGHKGHGRFYASVGKMMPAHRWVYEATTGPIPAGMQIDHECRVPSCVNPDHLRVVTHKQNCENKAGPNRNNTSGALGVFWVKRINRWEARVCHNRVMYCGGWFVDKADAITAVKALRNSLYTHNTQDGEARKF